jgi:hypothetical protein
MSRALVAPVLACRLRDQANPVSHEAEVRSGFDTTVCKEVINARLPGKAASHNL